MPALDQNKTPTTLDRLQEVMPRQMVAGGATFNACDYASVVDWLEQAAEAPVEARRARYVCVSNVADVMDARKDQGYSKALEESDLTVPDGAPVVWALRRAGHDIRNRVYGPTLMQKALENPRIAERRHLLVAGVAQAREGVRRRFADVNWCGEIDFRFDQLDESDYDRLSEQVAERAADYLWVSLGGGKQVRFMHRFSKIGPPCVMIGVGAAFDFHAGLLSQAPAWMQDNGLEWLYRLGCEPRRLWRRYLLHNPPFLYHLLREQPRRLAIESST